MTVVLRQAKPADCELLFNWVNERDSLAAKLVTTGPIARAEHEKWFAARLADPETFLWIIESGGEPIGQLRLMKKIDAYEVDIYVVGGQRQAGVARQALTSGVDMLSGQRPSAIVRARVKPDNVGSQRLFERAGFLLAARHGGHLVYELTTP